MDNSDSVKLATQAWIKAVPGVTDWLPVQTVETHEVTFTDNGWSIADGEPRPHFGMLVMESQAHFCSLPEYVALCDLIERDERARLALLVEPSDCPSDPARRPGWLYHRFLSAVLQAYFGTAGQLTDFDDQAFADAYGHLDRYMANPVAPDVVCLVHLYRTEVDGDGYELDDGVRLRPTTEAERKAELLIGMRGGSLPHAGMDLPAAYLELRNEKDRDAPQGISSGDQKLVVEQVEAVLLALRLVAPTATGEVGRWFSSDPPFPPR